MSAPILGGVVFGWDLVILICAVCLAGSAFFSGAETGYVSVSRVRLQQHFGSGDRRVDLLRRHLSRLEDPILTCLIGNNLFNVFISAVMTWVLTERYGPRGEWIAAAVISVLIILFAEILPKTLYREYPERLTVPSAPLLNVVMIVFAPIRWLLLGYSALWRRVMPSEPGMPNDGLDRSRLATLLLTRSNPDAGDQHFRQTLNRFLELSNRDLRSIMHPVDRLVTVRLDTSFAECLSVASDSGFSRLPVVAADDQLTGYILVRDLLFVGDEDQPDQETGIPGNLVRSFLLVDEAMSPYELFEELHSQRTQLAMVVDRDGRSLGMLTLEDLIEPIVGSIHDEFDCAGQPAYE